MKIPHVLGIIAIVWQKYFSVFAIYDPSDTSLHRCKDIESTSTMLRLKKYLFCDYDPSIRPTLHHQTVVNVTIKLWPMLLEFDEWSSTMTLHSWMVLTWSDAHLTWTPSEYDGITYVHIKSDELWVPDLSVYNSGDMSFDQTGVPSTTCLLFSTGSVTCAPSVSHTAKCITDFTYWPYDKHQCRINFGSWSHSGEEVNFHLDKTGFQMHGFTNNTEWDFEIVNAYKVLKKLKNDTYPMIVYECSLSRHYGMMHTTFVTPAIALALLTLTVLWLDSRSTERMAVGSVNFICHLICIFDLHWQLPHNGVHPPNILLFYRDSLALAAFALILTALLRKLQDMSMEVPYWISSVTTFVLSNKAGRFLILADEESKAGILANEVEENSDLPKSAAKARGLPWRHFAAIIEWLSFFCIIFIYIIILAMLMPYA
ncbi:hypothetical protein KM043_017767 [Ampulex compressa]|nr:hypothetical protein KM043_017767 [Ampulex compressa]